MLLLSIDYFTSKGLIMGRVAGFLKNQGRGWGFSPFSPGLYLTIWLLMSCFPVSSYSSSHTPLQTLYPDVKTISTDELHENFSTLTLVDIRNTFEFDVVHIAASINLPLDTGKFAQSIKNLADLKNEIILIIISNNPESTRAFEAARVAKSSGIKNVSVYDAGVFSWLFIHPKKTQLMGEIPAQLEKVLPQIRHQKHLISYNTLKHYAKTPEAIVIDIRNIYHQSKLPDIEGVKNIALESLLAATNSRIWAEKQLLIFDTDGSSTRWLQLFLQANAYYNYYFLDGGVNSLAKSNLRKATDTNNTHITIQQKKMRQLTATLSHTKKHLALFNYIISSIRTRSMAFISPDDAANDLNISVKQLRTLSLHLANSGYVRFLEMDDHFIYQTDPAIIWKGKMDGNDRHNSINQFHYQGIE